MLRQSKKSSAYLLLLLLLLALPATQPLLPLLRKRLNSTSSSRALAYPSSTLSRSFVNSQVSALRKLRSLLKALRRPSRKAFLRTKPTTLRLSLKPLAQKLRLSNFTSEYILMQKKTDIDSQAMSVFIFYAVYTAVILNQGINNYHHSSTYQYWVDFIIIGNII